ncbi:MAG: High molecular weight rubredoxin [Calditrichaeota bacterium]|nr:High molecular weight rubredoxin [Calditrichota bacterium]
MMDNPRGEEADIRPYRCVVCGYIYGPKVGDPEGGVKPGTPFAEMPNDWVCPLCGAGRQLFMPLDDS